MLSEPLSHNISLGRSLGEAQLLCTHYKLAQTRHRSFLFNPSYITFAVNITHSYPHDPRPMVIQGDPRAMRSRFAVIQNCSVYLCLCSSTHTSSIFNLHLSILIHLHCHLLSCTAAPRAIFARCTATSHSPKLAHFQVAPCPMSLFVVYWCVFPLFCYSFISLVPFP